VSGYRQGTLSNFAIPQDELGVRIGEDLRESQGEVGMKRLRPGTLPLKQFLFCRHPGKKNGVILKDYGLGPLVPAMEILSRRIERKLQE
jgi:hypothetical protein